ncbi:STAS domain-containing protein [Novosphingobium aerophilum]|uniref:STAS domain-containing protein n=1 Tax=Novosphingobium TaxID=165696 RepID=UPI0009EC000B|nr:MULTISPECIES: STAS domain-containing protein [unclassified Novosphingobium]MPS70622.1 anti-sigma factor antagonist [Novosphingobium sp.]TCM33696.1 STAS domain-containing protein [Novosphingobium sp. ST904]
MRQVVAVPGSVTVRSAHQFRQDILAGFDAGQDLDLDLSSLVEVDLAFLEIVYSARDHWMRAGRELRLAHPAGGPVAALLERAGFLTDPTPQDLEFWFHGELPQ